VEAPLGEQETLAGPASPADAPLSPPPPSDRYRHGDELGRGGMGVVMSWTDTHFGREVAAKVLIDGAPRARARFLHEARTQGRLEHPSIVPVHDLAALPDGRPFFTMQRVRGETLASVLASEKARFTRRKLLDAFARIALAVHYAHLRGVIHRDLKPANLMLGEFGEVYVLDWGIARLVSSKAEEAREPLPTESVGLTESGSFLGTPGYMGPEQARGDDDLDARIDVYALGCVLFELLTGEAMHQGKAMPQLLATPSDADRSPALRAPEREIPPELDALFLAATMPDRDARLATARELAEGIERYLEGDRDLSLRTSAAQEHARKAARLCDRALGKGASRSRVVTDAEAEEARRAALLEVSRAVALVPDHPLALATLVALLTEPPKRVPAEVQQELDDLNSAHTRVGGRTGALAYGGSAFLLALVVFFGARIGFASLVTVALFFTAGLASFAFSRLSRPSAVHSMLMLALSTAALASLTTLFGPFIGTPTAVCVNTMIFVVSNGKQLRPAIVAAGLLGTVSPTVLELVGVLPRSFRFHEGTLILLPRAVPLEPKALIAVGVCFVVTVVVSSLALVPFRDDLDDAQRKSRILSWQLRQFVPTRK